MDNITFKDVLNKISLYITNEEDQKRIEKAYLIAANKHKDQYRKSGDPYITHPLNVALILADLQVSPDTIIAGLLHDTVEDTDYTIEEIEKDFGDSVCHIVDGVTKLRKIKFESIEEKQAENQQKMLLAMGKDIRVIVVKLADRLHNIRTLDVRSEEKQKIIAKETLEIYAPLASRLGMFKIKAELEDRCLKYLDKKYYDEISDFLNNDKSKTENIDKIITDIKELLEKENIKSYSIKGRKKNLYSIYKKVKNKEKDLNSIYDYIAFRIIVKSIDDCYRVLGLIHAKYTPVPKRFKDYIAVPKPNMYQSLHTTVLSSIGMTFEVQIRTEEMDRVAELGIAAHWAYKEGSSYSKEKEQYEIASKLKWYGDLLKFNEEEEKDNAKQFVDSIKNDILTTNVYVYTPTGDVIDLPIGATPIDLAYKIHSEVGNNMNGCVVNNKIVTLDYELQNGDIVEIKTQKNGKGPSVSWLDYAITAHAKHKIKNFLNKQNKDVLIVQGKRILEEELKDTKNNISEVTEEFVKTNFTKNNIETLDELYFEIAKGNFSPKTISQRLLQLKKEHSLEEVFQKQIERNNKQLKHRSEKGIIVPGLINPRIKLAICCNPVPGDTIVGYVSKNDGIVVHNINCQNVTQLEQERLMDLTWDLSENKKYAVALKIVAKNNKNLLTEIMNVLAKLNIQVSKMNVINKKSLETVVKMKIMVSDKDALEVFIQNIKKIKNIQECKREGV